MTILNRFERNWLHQESRLADRMAIAPLWLQLLAILAFFCSFPLITSLFNIHVHPFYGIRGIQNTFYLVACLFSFSPLYVFFQSRAENKTRIQMGLYFLTLAITWQFVNVHTNAASLLSPQGTIPFAIFHTHWQIQSLIFPSWLATVASLVLRSSGGWVQKSFTTILLIGAFFGTLGLYAIDSTTFHHQEGLRNFWISHPDYILAFAIIFVWTKQPQRGTFLLNPAQCLWSIPWPVSVESAKSEWLWRWWWKGAINLLNAIMALTIDLLLLRASQRFSLDGFYFRSLILYFHFMLISVAGWNSVCAIARFYGIKAPEATRFQFLARHPLDLFLRKSTYVATFLRDTLWLPLAHRTRKPWMALFVTSSLVVFYIPMMHLWVIPSFYRYFFHDLPESRIELFYFAPQALGQTFLWALALLAWPLYRSIDRWSINPVMQFIFVVLNHLLCAISVEMFSQWIRSWNAL